MTTSVSKLMTLSAKLVDGLAPETTKDLDIQALLAFLKQNKYPLLALNHSNGCKALQELDEFKAARQNQESIHSSLRAQYVTVRDRWAAAGIPCILIKSAGCFPSFPYTSDNLDVLVKGNQAEAAAAILKELGYIELKNIEESHKYLFRKFNCGQCVSAIHLHTWVGWNVCFLDEEPLWQNSRTSPDDEAVRAPSPEDVILITLAHSFYENKEFRLGDIVKVRECWRHGTIDWAYLERAASQRGWLDGLNFCLLVCTHLEAVLWGETSIPQSILHGWETSLKNHPMTYRYYRRITLRTPVPLPFMVSFVFSKLLYYEKILHDRRLSLRERLTEVVKTLAWGIKLKTRIRPQSSFLISLSGADGSGKTEHAHTLTDVLTLCEIRNKYYWSRCGNSRLVRLLSSQGKTLLSSKIGTDGGKAGAPGRKGRLQNGVVRFFWSYLVAAEVVLTYFFHVTLPMLLGTAVICDRYVFDAAAEMDSALPASDKLNRLAIRIMLALTPKPDAAYLLDLSEETCAQRKCENTELEYLQQQRAAYSALAVRHNLRIKSTDREFKATTDEIINEILPSYYEGWETFFNGLFLSNSHQLNPGKQWK